MSQDDHKAQANASATLPDDTALLKQMVALLLQEKIEAQAERAEKKRVYEARNKSRIELSEYTIKQRLQSQSLCTHLKGGRIDEHHPRGPRIDYALYHHTYPDGTTAIRCQICGMKWKQRDTAEFLERGGQKVANHSGLGWLDVLKLLRQSTNTPSMSETNVTATITRPSVDPDFVAK